MAVNGRELGRSRVSMGSRWAGNGYLAGTAPVSVEPDAPDGRLRILNQPAVGRIVALDRQNFQVVASTRSKADGTWRIDHVRMDMLFIVVGVDDRGEVNGAVQDWVAPAQME